ncbi:hypothetical protein DCO58_10375 [Helicobacter saguini]|uniref:Uncharacterized protein n=1 Tax=Helicobacter saguini TaxID=1548018 RepID=A0A347VPM8_9HELI|nr:hypothetical protein [Helicobacter saguini]MWV61290.1 hypothetical protein [Helicobacter saguini]MWV68041.1 hypothetical protein [Helicobacter saguini]MWV70492.1 hypothetical protein [Helicobacter saguini]MWV72396.1 hypothetical protein [Helicobacter saguini]TLD91848.1 hypothetical protein LS64_011250 [Helicobacter saguini]
MGLIDFKFLQKIHLKFIDKVIHEDHPFGMILFANVNYIYILPRAFYIHRLRAGSTCDRQGVQNVTKKSMPTYTLHILDAFKGDAVSARAYYRAASWFIMFLEIKNFIESNPTNPMSKLTKEQFLGLFISESSMLLRFDIDPLNLIDKFGAFKGYINRPNSVMKLAIKNPKLYKKMLPLIRIYEKFTQIERRFRKFIKSKKS